MKTLLTSLSLIIITNMAMSQEFKVEHVNPTPGYTNVVAVTSGKIKTLYVAGQVGSGDTLEEQLRTSFKNVLKQLKDADAEFSHVVKMTLYIVSYRQQDLPIISKVRKEVFGEGKMPAITMLGVAALAFDNMKVETEVVAIVPIK